MKGRTTCPKCEHEFIMDVPENTEKHTVECPSCNHSFIIKRTCYEETDDECGWEEHGEPRKTILSSLRKKTSKPIYASFLLLAICVLGIFTAVIFWSSTESLISEFEFITEYLSSLGIDNLVLAVAIFIFSIFTLAGSITAYMRRYFAFTALCAFLGIFTFGLFVGLVLSIIALGLILVSRDEFENATKGKVF